MIIAYLYAVWLCNENNLGVSACVCEVVCVCVCVCVCLPLPIASNQSFCMQITGYEMGGGNPFTLLSWFALNWFEST